MRQEKWAEVRIAFDSKSNGRHSSDLNNTGGVVVAKPDLHFETPALLAVWRWLQGEGVKTEWRWEGWRHGDHPGPGEK